MSISVKQQPPNTTAMAPSRGDLQKQLSAVLSGIKSQGYKIEDVIADDVHHHLPGLAELTAARSTIADLELHMQHLKAQNVALTTNLEAKTAELESQPSDILSLRIELQQATRQIQLFQDLASTATHRAERYQSKLTTMQRHQTATDTLNATIDSLTTQLHSQLSAYNELLHTHNTAITTAAEEQDRNAHALAAQRSHFESRIAAQATDLETAKQQLARMDAETQALSDAHTSLIDSLEEEHASISAAVNKKAFALQRVVDTIDHLEAYVAPLDEFFQSAVDMLNAVYGVFASSVRLPSSSSPYPSPRSSNLHHAAFNTHLNTATQALLSHQHVRSSLSQLDTADATTDTLQAPLLVRLEDIAASAGLMFECFDEFQHILLRRDDEEGKGRKTNSSAGKGAERSEEGSSKGQRKENIKEVNSFAATMKRFSIMS